MLTVCLCFYVLSVSVTWTPCSATRPWTQASSDRNDGAVGEEGLTLYSLESLNAQYTHTHTPNTHPPPHQPTTPCLPHSLLHSPKRPQALEMHACVALLCGALSVCEHGRMCVLVFIWVLLFLSSLSVCMCVCVFVCVYMWTKEATMSTSFLTW